MSDYLANLVAKARNAASVVQPRPLSPFEPSPAAGTPINVRDAEAESAPEERFAGDTPDNGPLTTSTLFTASAHAGLPRTDAGASTAAAPPLRSFVANADAPHHRLAMAGSSSTTPAASPFTVKEGAIVDRPDTSSDARVHSRRARPPESVFTPQTEPARPAMVISRERVVSLPAAAAHDRPAATPAPDEAPTIKISIGRVDVRAIMPAPPAPRRASARRAALSLDDYLKHQGERKR